MRVTRLVALHRVVTADGAVHPVAPLTADDATLGAAAVQLKGLRRGVGVVAPPQRGRAAGCLSHQQLDIRTQ